MNIVRVASAEEMPKAKEVGFDIETSPLRRFIREGRNVPPDPRLTKVVLAQVAVGDNVYVLDKNFGSLKGLLEDEQVTKIIHNASFEMKHMLHKGINIRNVEDTMILEGVIENGRKVTVDLESVARRHLGVVLNKKVRDRFVRGDPVDDQMVEYAAEDAWVLPKLYDKRVSSKDYYPGISKVLKLEKRLIPVVAQMELDGFKIDVEKWSKLADRVELNLVAIRDKLINELPIKVKRLSMFGGEEGQVNLNSRDKVLELMQSAGIDLDDLKKGSVEQALSSKNKNSMVLKLYQAYSLLQKASSTYGYGFLEAVNPITRRVHSTFRQVGPRTGRFAGTHPNPMNVPNRKSFRECFVPEPDSVLCVLDYVQQELVLLAELSRDQKMIEAFEQGIDFHVYTAGLLLGAARDIDKKSPLRRSAKTLNFGLIYGMGAQKLARALGCSLSEAEELMGKHAEVFSQAFSWMAEVVAKAGQSGYVETLIGRRRHLDITENKYEREARNTPIQGSGADMIKLALILMSEKGVRPINVIHDEIVAECKKKDSKEVYKEMQKGMVKAGEYLCKNVRVGISGYISTMWVN